MPEHFAELALFLMSNTWLTSRTPWLTAACSMLYAGLPADAACLHLAGKPIRLQLMPSVSKCMSAKTMLAAGEDPVLKSLSVRALLWPLLTLIRVSRVPRCTHQVV